MELIINKSPFTWQSLNFCDLLWTPLSILLFLFSSDHSIASSSESQAINKRNCFPWTTTARKGTIYFIYTCNLLIPIFNTVTTTKTTAKLLNGLVLRAPRNLMGIDIKPKLNWKPSLWPRKWETINKFSSQVKRATFTWSEGMGPKSVRTGEKRPICRDKSHFIHQLFLNLSIGWRPTATKESATVFWSSSTDGWAPCCTRKKKHFNSCVVHSLNDETEFACFGKLRTIPHCSHNSQAAAAALAIGTGLLLYLILLQQAKEQENTKESTWLWLGVCSTAAAAAHHHHSNFIYSP